METVRALSDISLTELKAVVLNANLGPFLPPRKSRLGRRGYAKLSLFLAYILWLRERMLHITELTRRLKENQTFREFCGFKDEKVPSHDTLSRFFRALTPMRKKRIFHYLDTLLARSGVFDADDLALDATDILSNSRNQHNLDPEAGWGHKSDGERFHGYWGLFLVGTKSEMIRDVAVTPANVHQSTTALRMIRRLTPARQRNALLFLADGALDDKKNYAAVIEQAMVPLITYNPRNAKIKTFLKLSPRNWRYRALGEEGLQLWKNHKHDRGSVERYNSTFKYLNGGRSIPVRGLCNVTGYTLGITILAQLSSLALVSRRHSPMVCPQRSLPEYIPTLQTPTEVLCSASS